MKSIRRSLNKDKDGGRGDYTGERSPPLPQSSGFRPTAGQAVQPPASRVTPPKLVIRATSAYRSRAPNELSFATGDFFHVVGGSPDSPFFDAANPATGVRGLVPKAHFQVLGRNERETKTQQPGFGGAPSPTIPAGPQNAGRSFAPSSSSSGSQPPRANGIAGPASSAGPRAATSPPAPGQGKAQSLYGVVQFDFEAQRADELEARKGEAIIIVAQSNHEWFVAKPIGRLGGPGLIPVSFVEIQNMATGKALDPTVVNEMIRGGALPPVEEWKKMTAEYKQSSIALGRFDFGPGAKATSPPADGSRSPGYGPNGSSSRSSANGDPGPSSRQKSASPPSGMRSSSGPRQTSSAYEPSRDRLAPASGYLSQSTPSLHGQTDRGSGGGRSRASYTDPAAETITPDNAFDHYGLVVQAVVESFHFEEGSFWFHVHCAFATGASLIIYRLYEDFHSFQIALMNEFPVEAGRELPPGAKRGEQVRRILPMMPGPATDVDEVLCAQRVGDLSVYLTELCHLPDYILANQLVYDFLLPRPGDVEIATPPPLRRAPGSTDARSAEHDVVEYLGRMPGGGDGNARRTPEGQIGRGVQSLRLDETDPNRRSQRSSTRSDLDRSDTRERERERQSGARSAASQHSGRATPNSTPASQPPPIASGSVGSSGRRPGSYGLTSPTSTAPTSAGSNGQSNGPTPSFIKIKIFHRNTDDLIAIRVPPNVTFAALLDKARDRLGADVAKLRFREEVAGLPNVSGLTGNGARLVEIGNDHDLGRWLSGQNQKLVLYAD